MIFAYRKTSVLYQAALGLTTLFSLGISVHFSEKWFLLMFIPLQLVLMYVIWAICENMAEKITKQYTDLLDRDMRPQAFLDAFQPVADAKRRDGSPFALAQWNQARACWLSGKTQRAVDLLNSIMANAQSHAGSPHISCQAVLTLMQICLQNGKDADAEKLYRKCFQNLTERQRLREKDVVRVADALHLLCIQDHAGAITALEEQFRSSEIPLQKALAGFFLAMAYRAAGDADKSDSCYRFVAEHSGETILKGIANERTKQERDS